MPPEQLMVIGAPSETIIGVPMMVRLTRNCSCEFGKKNLLPHFQQMTVGSTYCYWMVNSSHVFNLDFIDLMTDQKPMASASR